MDRSEPINLHLHSVNLTPTNIPEKKTFQVKDKVAFDLCKLDVLCAEKKLMTEAVLKMLTKTADISNSSLVKNADGLLSKKPC